MNVERFEVWEFDSDVPYVILSRQAMNSNLQTVIVAPIYNQSSTFYPSRVQSTFLGAGEIRLDEIRTVNKIGFKKKLGSIREYEQKAVCQVLAIMFEYD